MMGKEVFVA